MDGDGEELVAIVQGLDAPGLTFTVSNRSRRNEERRRPSRPRIHTNRAEMSPAESPQRVHRVDTMPATTGVQSVTVTRRASVETTTGADFTKVNRGSQICDDRYTSSYKLAHCQMTPTSPPEAVSEFPPQRREPCRNQGNFEIGGNGSAQWSFHSEQESGQGFRQASRSGQVRASTSRIRQNGGSQIWRDQGSSHRYCSPKRETEAFEQSLRKYPNMAPFRTASHDLIEKLIRYTQAKNFQEMSRSSKSVRSLRYQKAADTEDLQSKHQQTYTRRQDNNQPSSSGVQVGHVGRTGNFKLYSPMSDSRNLRNRETAFSTSYDYLKAGSRDGRSNRSDGSPSPTGSKSPEDSRSPVRSPVRFGSPVESKAPGSPGGSRRPERPIRFERSVRDLSLNEMSKYIRNTVRQICNEKPVVFQVCPKLKNRYNQHKRVCPNKSEQMNDLLENEEQAQASGSVLSRIIRSFSGWSMPLTDAECQCNRADCYCTRATQCAYDSEVSTNTVGCSCRTRTIEAKTGCSRDLTCVCARKAHEQAYYYKRIDEAISEWLKDVPVNSIECVARKNKRETAIKELRQTLKQLPDDEDFGDNVRNEISSFIDDFPSWNPGEDEADDIMFKNQLADKLIDKIVAIPRKADRFREIVTKWIENLDFDDDNEELEMDVVIDNFVNKLKSLAAERPACDMKYTHILRKEITELLVELPLNYDSVMFKRKAHQLATEIVNLPRNIKLSGDTDSTSVFEENISEWICEHGLCRELKKDPKFIEGLANKLKSQGIGDEELIETMNELIFEFVDDMDTAIGILDEFIDELIKTVPSFVQKDNLYFTKSMIGDEYSEPKAKRFDQDELHEVVIDWISNLPGASDLSPSKFEETIEDIVTMVQDRSKQGNEDLENNIFEYIVDTGLPIDLSVLHTHVDELLERLNVLPPSEDLVEQAKQNMVKEMFKIIDASSMSEEKQEELRKSALKLVQRKLSMMSSLHLLEDPDDVKEALLADMSRIIDKFAGESQEELKNKLSSSLSTIFDTSFIRLGKDESDLKQTIEKNVRKAVVELPVDSIRKEDLMGQVNKTLCKHMNKPLPPNCKNIINDNISDILEKCPISEDRSLCGRLKKTLFDVVGQYLDILLPKPVCDFQCQIEKNVGMVIDKCPIDPDNKIQLKKCVQDIFTKSGDCSLSEEVVRTIQEEIYCVCNDLPIPNDKKRILKKAVGASVSKNLNDALSSLSHDLIKLRKRLYDTMTNVIEKSPITRDVKTNLKSQLKSVLVRNLDSSLSDEEKHNILDEVSTILKDDMSGEEITNLTNKLSSKMDTFQRKEKTKDLAEMITKDIDQLINRLSIDSGAKEDVKNDIKAVLLDTLYNPLTIDKQHKIKEDIINKIDDIDIPKNEKKLLKSNVARAITKELNKLIAQGKEVPEIKTALEGTIGNEIKGSLISKDKQDLLDHKLRDVLAENLVRDVTNEEKEATRAKITDIVDDLKIDKDKSEALKFQLLNDADKYFDKSAQDRMQTKELTAAEDESISDYQRDYKIQNKILQGLENCIDEASIPEAKKIELKTKLRNIAAKNLKKPLSGDAKELTEPELKELEHKTKQNILQGLENVINEAPLPKEKKNEAKKKLKDLTTQQFKNQLSDDVAVGLKDDMDELIDEMNLPKDKKDKLKKKLTATVDDNMSDLRSKTKSSQNGVDDLKALDKETKINIERGLENVIAEAPLPKDKKIEVKKKLKDLTTQQFKNQLSDDVAVGLKDDMDEIIDDMNLSKDKRAKLKSDLTAVVDDNMRDMQRKIKDVDSNFPKTNSKGLEKEIQANFIRELENVIDSAPIPKEKKTEVKKKLRELVTQHFKNQLSDDVPVELKEDMNQIIDEMNLPKDKKNKLKKQLNATVDDNMNNFRNQIKPSQKGVDDLKALDKETKVNIERGLENVIAEAPLPTNKKIELKKKLKDLTTQQFKNQLSDDVAVGLIEDMNEIIDEMNLPKDKKDKLKKELTATVDDNMRDLQSKTKSSQKGVDDLKALDKETKINIERGLENVIAEAPLPKDKKIEVKKKLKDLTTQQFKNQLSDDVAVGLKDDMDEIIDEMNLPKDKRAKLKSDLTAIVDDNMRDMQRKIKDVDSNFPKTNSKGLEKEIQANFIRELENVIDAAPIPKEKKTEVKKKLRELVTQHFKNQLSDDVPVELKEDMNQIIDEMNLPKDKKNKLKKQLNATVDDNMNNFRNQTKPSQKGVDDLKALDKETKVNIERGLENVIAEAPLPTNKKIELKNKLKDLTTQQFKNQLSDDVAVGLKDDMNEIIDEMNLPKDKKDKLIKELTATVDDNMSDLRTKTESGGRRVDNLDKETKVNIERGLENVINEAPLPKEEKIDVKKKLKDLTTQLFKNQLSDDVAVGLKDDMDEIIDEMNLPKDKRAKLKSALTAIVDDNMRDMQRKIKDVDSNFPKTNSKGLEKEIQANFIREFENSIDAAPIPKENKAELKNKLRELVKQHFKKQLSDDVAVGLKDDMDEVINEMNLPKDKKDKLKKELTATVDDNMSDLRSKKKSSQKGGDDLKTLDKETKMNIERGLENVIAEASLPKDKKIEVKKKLKDLTTQQFKNQLSDDVAVGLKDDMDEIIDEMNLPKDKRAKLKSDLTAIVDDNMRDMQRKIKDVYSNFPKTNSKGLEKEIQASFIRKHENVIDAAPIPKEKKTELKKKLRELVTQHFQNQLSDDFPVELKEDMNQIIDEMNLPKDKKDKLKKELNATVDDNLSNFRNKTKPSQKEVDDLKALDEETKVNIERGLENVIAEAPLSKEKKIELKKQLKDLTTHQFKSRLSDDVAVGLKDDMDEIVDEMNLPKDKKDKLKNELTATVDDNMSVMKRKIKDAHSEYPQIKSKDLENEAKVNLQQGLVKFINEAPIPKEKKLELKKQVQDLSTKYFKKPLFENAVEELQNDINEVIGELNLPKDKKDELKDELTATVDENMRNLQKKIKDDDYHSKRRPSILPIGETRSKNLDPIEKKDRVMQGIEKVIEKSAIPENKKRKLSGVLQKIAADDLKKRLSLDVQDKGSSQIDDFNELKRITQSNLLLSQEKAVAKAKIPKELRKYLKNKMKELTMKHFMKPLTDNTAQEIKDDINNEIDDLNLSEELKDQLKFELDEAVDENMRNLLKHLEGLKIKPDTTKGEHDELIGNGRKTALKEQLKDIFDKYGIDLSYEDQLAKEFNKLLEIARKGGDFDDARNKLIKKLMKDLNLPEEEASALADELIDRARKMVLKEELRDIFDKYGIDPSYEDRLAEEFNKLLQIACKGGDFEDARNKLIKKLMKDLNIPKEEASALADELIDRARKMALNEQTRDLLEKYGIDPSYEDQLAEEFNKLLEIARKGGDFEDARNKLIKKLMKDLNIPEEEARAIADELIDRARKMALKEQTRDLLDKYGIDPSYEDQLAEEFNKLLEIARKGGDFEDARNKLIKKLMKDLNIPEEEARAIADELIDRARKMALKEQTRDLLDKYGIDPSYEDQLAEEFNKLLEIARKGGDFEDARNKLIKKLMQDLNLPEEEATALADELIDRARKMALEEQLRDIFDKYGIDPSYADKLVEEFKKILEIAQKDGDLEDAKGKLIKILMRDLNLSEAEASALADDLIARAREMALASKITEAFTQAISDAVDQSTIAKADKPILKNKLLSKLKQILDKKPYIHKDDVGPLKEEVIKECYEIVDESSISTDKKNELKHLLKEKLDKAFAEDEDGEAENLTDYKDKITKAIKKWMDSLPIHLEPKVAATVADNIASDILDRHKYLYAHPEAKSSEKDEIENLKFQVFRRMYRVVNPKAIPKIMERTPDLYKTIMKIKPPPQEPKRLPKPKDAFAKAGSGAVEEKTLPLVEDPLAQKKIKELKKVFAKSVDQAIVESSLAKPDKSSLKKRLLEDLGITRANRKKAEKYDVGPSDAMDKSPTALEYKKKIRECVTTWLKTLPIDLDPKTAASIADNLTNDILERQKYLKTHLEAVSTDEDEIENLMYQVFRRLKDIADAEGIPDIKKRTEDLYNMIMNIKKELESQKGLVNNDN